MLKIRTQLSIGVIIGFRFNQNVEIVAISVWLIANAFFLLFPVHKIKQSMLGAYPNATHTNYYN